MVYVPAGELNHSVVWSAVHDQIPRAIRESHLLDVWEDAGVMFGKLTTDDGSKYFTFVLERGLVPDTDFESDVKVPGHVILQLCVVV